MMQPCHICHSLIHLSPLLSWRHVASLVAGFGSAVYLIANQGAGPRDGLMTGLNKIAGQPFMNIRIALEVIVVTIGYFMGGVVGLGALR